MILYVCVLVDEVSRVMDDISTSLAHCIPLLRFLNSQLPDDLRLETFQLRQLPVEESVNFSSSHSQADTHQPTGQLSSSEEEVETAYEDAETAYEDFEEEDGRKVEVTVEVEPVMENKEQRTLVAVTERVGGTEEGEGRASGSGAFVDAVMTSQEGTHEVPTQEGVDRSQTEEVVT